MEGDRISQVRAELTRLFDEQVEFFRRRAQQQPTPAELREYQERRERIRQYLRNYADCEKRHKWRLGVRRSAHFVGWMRLCEARARFSNRSS